MTQTNYQISIDRNAAITHVSALGYEPDEKLCLRFFYPDGNSRKAQDKGIKCECKFPHLPWELIARLQAEGRGCYFVVNSGGHRDADIIRCHAIFYEHDHLDKEISRELWQHLGLPEPTIQIDTGGKSVHSYWRVTHSTVEQWQKLQTDLLEFADGDRKIKNPSRVMRLAGAYHITPGREPIQSTIVSNFGKIYTFEALREIVPEQSESLSPRLWTNFEKNFRLPVIDQVPLIECLSRANRTLVKQGTGEGQRNDRGYVVACDLVGTSNYLDSIGQLYFGEPKVLFEEYCSHCSPPLETAEIESIWRSAEKRSTKGSLSPTQIEGCIKGWVWQQRKTEGESKQNGAQQKFQESSCGGAEAIRVSKLSIEQLRSEISSLLNTAISGSELTTAILDLSTRSEPSTSDIWKLYYELQREQEYLEELEEVTQEIENLLKAKQSSISLFEFLPIELATPLQKISEWQNLRPECYLIALLCVVSAIQKNGTELVLHRALGFTVSPNLFAVIVAEVSQKKSPVIKAMIRSPLKVLNSEAREIYNSELERYEVDSKAAEAKGSEKPKKPERKIYFFTKTTGEAILRQASRVPEQGLLWLTDELPSIFKGANQYRSGRGSDTEDILEYYDGTGGLTLRADGVKDEVDSLSLGIFGGIQPGVLEKHIGDGQDADGKWARFFFIQQPTIASELPDDDHGIDLQGLLAGLYRKVAEIPKQKYTLSRDAFKYFQAAYNRLERLRVEDSNPALRAVWGKTAGRIGKLAENLHVIQQVTAGAELPATEIQKSTLILATRLAHLAVQQIQGIYQTSGSSSLSSHLLEIIELSHNKGWIKARDVQQTYTAKKHKWKPEYIREMFCNLKALRYGTTRGTGKQEQFCVNSRCDDQSVDVADIIDSVASTGESAASSNLEKPVEVVDICHTSLEQEIQVEEVIDISRSDNSKEIAIADRVLIHHYDQWKYGIVIQVPIKAPHGKSIRAWKVRLDTGHETYIWERESLVLSEHAQIASRSGAKAES